MKLVKVGEPVKAPEGVVQATRDNGIAFARAGEDWFQAVTFPGISPVLFSKASLQGLIEGLEILQNLSGGSAPDQVWRRSATVDPSGNITGRFSDAPRARHLTVPEGEVTSLIALLRERLDNWDTYLDKIK